MRKRGGGGKSWVLEKRARHYLSILLNFGLNIIIYYIALFLGLIYKLNKNRKSNINDLAPFRKIFFDLFIFQGTFCFFCCLSIRGLKEKEEGVDCERHYKANNRG